MDAGNMLKPALARGELHCIGATTLDEYRKHIEKDAALERRFQPVLVDEPSGGGHHLHPARPQGALRDAPRRAHHRTAPWWRPPCSRNRYITDRFLPDKAIDLVDEAASRLRMESDTMPAELDEIERRGHAARDGAQALRKEKDAASKERLAALEKTLADLQEENTPHEGPVAAGEGRRSSAWAPCATRSTAAKLELEQAQRTGDWERASRLQYETLRGLQTQLDAETAAAWPSRRAARCFREEVTEEDIAQVVAKWTGIPVSKLLEGEVAKLLQMEDRLHERVVGQDEAVAAVSNAVRRARAGLGDPQPAHRQLSSSWAPPAWARPSWPGPWPSSSSTTRTPWSAST